MNVKYKIIKIIKNHNEGRPVGVPIIDRIMTKYGVFGGILKVELDNYVKDNLIVWTDSLSLSITEKGIEYLMDEDKI
ncbi:hypothetical protein ETU08_09120 [Apibacter muscae]|uniref:Uncharacterized protein n=1 Tax=Apibacter muscae TaxID=2509004 RepID=A0A563DB92_9FLAO|nr:hypothetical protein [Apibacter muscae]TWP27480.1 hypothetical protein ETU09_07470 [Apibacter muscae]TWP28394.1 hypothetical protein ETU08_09120 [Apibacter muscae]